MKTKLREGGRIVIPTAYRKVLGIKPGDELILTLQDKEIRLVSTREAITHAQSLVRQYVPKGRKLSEELIKERHDEASRG